jgi:tetratricopeptide (TPR) repeat protein
MWLDIVLTIGIVIGLLTIVFLVLRTFPALAAVDVNSIPEEREAAMKEKILSERFARKASENADKVSNMFVPMWKAIQAKFRALFQKFADLERKYKRKYKPLMGQEELEDNVGIMIERANKLIEEGKFGSAEKLFIEVITLDHINYYAYMGLGEVYVLQKEFDQARQVYEYVSQHRLFVQAVDDHLAEYVLINSDADEEALAQKHASLLSREEALLHIDLAQVYKSLHQDEKALPHFKSATELEPNNPRYLDFLLECAISLNDRELAIQTFERLQEVNPKNHKLDGFGEQIKAMLSRS